MVGYAAFAINAEDIIDKAKSVNNNNKEDKNDLALCALIFCTYTPSYR
jgi:hypothetical protein